MSTCICLHMSLCAYAKFSVVDGRKGAFVCVCGVCYVCVGGMTRGKSDSVRSGQSTIYSFVL